MAVGVLLVTHNQIGTALLNTAESTLGTLPLLTHSLSVSQTDTPEERIANGSTLLAEQPGNDGILLLTDAWGSTPANIALQLHTPPNTALVAGVNLPMLLRIYNYANCTLAELADIAVSGGQMGIMEYQA